MEKETMDQSTTELKRADMRCCKCGQVYKNILHGNPGEPKKECGICGGELEEVVNF
jgi:rRNA maturation endonuclease Nob1